MTEEKGKSTEQDLTGISPASIEKYMLKSGWMRKMTFPNPKMMVFYREDNPEMMIAAPAVSWVRDYAERVRDLISSLSVLNSCSETEAAACLRGRGW